VFSLTWDVAWHGGGGNVRRESEREVGELLRREGRSSESSFEASGQGGEEG
jgi:hypothetical protein